MRPGTLVRVGLLSARGVKGVAMGSDAWVLEIKADNEKKDSEGRGAGRSTPWAGQVVIWMKWTPEGLMTAGAGGGGGCLPVSIQPGPGCPGALSHLSLSAILRGWSAQF